jgi:uncharacterized membrane protein YfcA
MPDATLIFVGGVFALAGFVKGIIGMGLPTISMGLLAVVMPPVEAAAILILPSFVTNISQMLGGPSLTAVLSRLWRMMIAVCVGTWAGLGLMTGASARYGTTLLGGALVIYAAAGLATMPFAVPAERERLLGSVAGALTGLIAAATGVFVIPAVPYLQAIGLQKEELIQALGLSFTVSTVALAVNVAAEGGLSASATGSMVGALALACVGMWVGQKVRLHLTLAVFQKWFLAGLLLLGFYLIARSAHASIPSREGPCFTAATTS